MKKNAWFFRRFKSCRNRAFLLCAEALERRLLLSTYTVDTLSDAINPGPNLLSLRQAVADVNAVAGANTITFSPTLFPAGNSATITLTQGELLFTNAIGTTAIDGPGESSLIVSGNNASRAFDVAAGAMVSLSGLTVVNGLAPEGADDTYDGGGIYNAGSLSLDHIEITACRAYATNSVGNGQSSYGGGVYSTGSLTITDSLIEADTAAGNPNVFGANSNSYGGGIYAAGNLTISNSSVSNDSVDGVVASEGGGIYCSAAAALTKTILNGDSAVNEVGTYGVPVAEGGGIFAADLTIGQSTVSGDSARASGFQNDKGTQAYGGGIAASGILLISQTSISGNSAVCENGVYSVQGGGDAKGGGVYATSDTTISNSVLSGNSADAGSAGTSTSVGTTSFYGNTAGDGGSADGGGIAVVGPGGSGANTPLLIESSTLANNESFGGNAANGLGIYGGAGGEGGGGGVFVNGDCRLVDSTITGNSASGGNGGNGSVYYNPPSSTPSFGGNGGGAIGGVRSNQNLESFDSTITGNTAAGGAGGEGSTYDGSSEPNGTAGVSDGGVYSATMLLDNSIVSGNSGADVSATDSAIGSNNLIGTGSTLTNGVNGNIVGVTDPMLSPLGNYGGPTQTMPPLPGSPAIDAGDNAFIPSGVITDQRGYARVFNNTVDIGADEYGASPPVASSTTIAASSNSITVGASATLTATVSATIGGATPTGTVSFTDNGAPFGSAILQADGTATLTTSSLPVGTDMILASYGGDSTHSGSTSATLLITVAQPPVPQTSSVTTVTSISPNPASLDTSVTISGIVAPSSDSGPTPTGFVNIYDGSTSLGVAAVQNNGSFTLSTSALPAGTDSITASYSGDSIYATSASSPLTETVIESTAVPSFGNTVLPLSVVAGAKLSSTLPVTITNGGVALKGKFTVNVYMSMDDALDGSQLLLGTKKKHVSLKAGKEKAFSFNIRSLPTALAVGKYHILAEVIDPTGAINVTATMQTVQVVASVIKPMVTVGSVNPPNVARKKPGSILITVSNNGTIAASGIRITLSPSADSATPIAGVILDSIKSVVKIQPNKSKVFRLHFKVPDTLTPGNYFPYVSASLGGVSTTGVGSTQFTVG